MNKSTVVTESGLIKSGEGTLESLTINSHTSGTVKLYDGTEAGVVAVGTITQSVGAGGKAVHGTSVLTSSGASVPGTHAVSVFTKSSAQFLDATKGSGVLTLTGTNPTAAQTVVLGNVTYTFGALGSSPTLSATAANVPLGNNSTETANNLYNAMLQNDLADVVKTSALVITATAKTAGTAGNMTATEDSSVISWDDGSTLTGGTDAETITIGSRVYTWKDTITSDASATACQVKIGSTLTISLANLVKAINNSGTPGLEYSFVGSKDPAVRATASDATTVTVRGIVPGTSLNTTATTETCATGSWPDTTLGGGTGASDPGVTTGAATVTIDTTVYTVVDELSENYAAPAVAFQVKKGASEATMLDNLKAAINGTGTAGTEYSTGTTAHPTFIATTNADTTQEITARAVGDNTFTAAVNAMVTEETLANTAWTGADITNGTAAQVSTEAAEIIINGRVYTVVTALSETSGADAVADQILWVTDEATFLDNLKLAINASGTAGTDYSTGTTQNYDVKATTNGATTQVIEARNYGVAGNSITTTAPMTNYAWGATTLASGAGATSSVLVDTITFSAVATTGEREINFDSATFERGLYATIGGTANLTVIYN